jgi:hypothetical protein
MKVNIRQILVVAIIGLVSIVSSLLFTGTAKAVSPPYSCFPVVDGVLVEIDVWSSEADRDTVCTTFNNAVSGSNTFKNRVIAGGQAHNNYLQFNVYRDSTAVSIGHVPLNLDNSCCKGIVYIDLGDIEAVSPHLEDFDPGNKSVVVGGFLTDVLAHEIEHTTGTDDPQIDIENQVLSELGLGYERNNYADCRTTDSKTIVEFIVGFDAGYFNYSNFWQYRKDEGSFVERVCPGETAVGGIAELPEIAQTPLETTESSSSNYVIWAGIAAATTVGLIGLIAAIWYARRRSLS